MQVVSAKWAVSRSGWSGWFLQSGQCPEAGGVGGFCKVGYCYLIKWVVSSEWVVSGFGLWTGLQYCDHLALLRA